MSKNRRSRATQQSRSLKQDRLDIEKAHEQAEELIQSGKPGQAIELLKPLAERFKRDGNLQYHLGYAYTKAGDDWQGIAHYRKALELLRDPGLCIPLGYLYLNLEFQALGLDALRRAIRHDPGHPLLKEALQNLPLLEEEISALANMLNLPVNVAEEGLQLMEEGQIALHDGDYSRCIHINRKAIKILGNFPPPHNNLSLAQFFSGQPQAAIQTARQVLENYPDNIQAMANLIRFLAWSGQESEAREYWEKLRQQTPAIPDQQIKMLEAAAMIEDDQMVYRLAIEVEPEFAENRYFAQQISLYRAIAEANLGMRPASRKKLNQLKEEVHWANDILKAVKNGQPGLGWSPRFPYFHASELIPMWEFEAFVEILKRQDSVSPKRFRRDIEQFAARFPQIVLVGKKTIIEDQQFEAGIRLLEAIGSPAAYAVLREFGLSQVGSDEARRQALFILLRAGQIQTGESVRVWQEGQWQEIILQSYEITDEGERDYSQQVADLLNRALEAYQKDNNDQAERLFLRALELEPRALEAYNNLGTIYAHRKDHEQAKAMFRKAIEVDPLYVVARCNLAAYLLDEEGVEAAEAMLAPITEVQRYNPQSFAFLSFVRARIAIAKDKFDIARSSLELALEVYPDYEPAHELLQNLEEWETIKSSFKSWQEGMYKRQQSSRARLQKKLSTTDPALGESLGIYTKELMTGMASTIVPYGSWSALKKAELHQHLVESLQDPDVLKRVIAGLGQDKRQALGQVLERGGYMPWKEFEALYGNDLEDSPYWQYHVPESIMGHLRLRGLLVEAQVEGEIILAIPLELRRPLEGLLAD
ncbi:MAG: tetratricopeptide repeat protein [Anaerolineales bacterium]|nr:tetratricopeptide repeat protein [Anaerolineales bacterium]